AGSGQLGVRALTSTPAEAMGFGVGPSLTLGRWLGAACDIMRSFMRSAHHAMTLEKRDHFDGRRFANPTGVAGQPFSAVPRMLLEPRTPWPARIDEPPRRPPALDAAIAVVTLIGHATFLIQTAAGNILTDPMYSQRAGPFSALGPRRVRQPAVRFDDLPPISIVLLSHNHYDHCDLRTLGMLAKRLDPLVVTPLGNGALVRSSGIRQVEELDWWQDAKTSALPIALTPAYHFS